MDDRQAFELAMSQDPAPDTLGLRAARRLYGGWLLELERSDGPWGWGSPFRIVNERDREVVHVAPNSFVEDYVVAFEARRRREDETGEVRTGRLDELLFAEAGTRWRARSNARSLQRADSFLEIVGVQPDRTGLLSWIAERISADEVRTIAEADHGQDAEANIKALRRILELRTIPAPIDTGGSWVQEVCELTKWRANDNADHLAVALACTILILAAAPGEPLHGHVMAMSDPVGALVLALRGVDAAANPLAAGLLADACRRYDEDEQDDLFCAFGIVALHGRVDERTARYLIEWEEEAAANQALDEPDGPPRPEQLERFQAKFGSEPQDGRSNDWLFRLTYFDQMKSGWRELLASLEGEGSELVRRLVVSWG